MSSVPGRLLALARLRSLGHLKERTQSKPAFSDNRSLYLGWCHTGDCRKGLEMKEPSCFLVIRVLEINVPGG